MKRIIITISVVLILFLFTFNFRLSSESLKFKEVQKIGSEELHQIFFSITGVDLDSEGNIYVADGKQCSIKKYSKEGGFLKETGRCGKGPGDFSKNGIIIRIYKNKLYAYDEGNKRIFIMNKNLERIKTVKFKGKSFFGGFIPIGKLFYGPIFIAKVNDPNRIYAIDYEGKKTFSFFKKYPDYMNIKKDNTFKMGIGSVYSSLIFDYSFLKAEFTITFRYPGRKMILFYYKPDGKYIGKNEFVLLKNYKFPEFYLSYPIKYPKKHTVINIDSIHYYKDRYVFVNYKISEVKKTGNRKQSKDRSYVIVVDTKTGKIIDKTEIPSGMRILKIKGDYMYAKNFDDEIETLHIYKIGPGK